MRQFLHNNPPNKIVFTIEPLIGGLILVQASALGHPVIPIEPLIGGLIRPCGNEELEMRNEQSTIIFLGGEVSTSVSG